MVNYGVIGKEIGTILSQYNSQRLLSFKGIYGKELEKNLNELRLAKQDFFALASKDYTNPYLKYIGQTYGGDETSNFFYTKDRALSDFMNDRTDDSSKRLWKAIEDSERTITKIRSAIYGEQSKTKYHIGISIKDSDGQKLKSFELDPEQMLKLQNNQKIFKADISLNKKGTNFSLKLTTQDKLKSQDLIDAITEVGGYQYHEAGFDQLINMQKQVSQALSKLNEVGDITQSLDFLTSQVEALTEERTSLGRRIKDGASARRHEIDQQKKDLLEQIKGINRYEVQELGLGRAFEAYERKMYNLEWLPTRENGLRYNDNTSWIMQQDINFIEYTNQAALTMIQNKFFSEGSRFSTISLQSLFTAQNALFDYFTESANVKWEFTEKDKKRLDTEVQDFAQQFINETVKDTFKGIDMGD